MDQRDLERLRRPNFDVARRGYDTREVDRFLSELVDWLQSKDGLDEIGNSAVKHKLELAGQTTSQILLTAEQEAEDMRRRAGQEATERTEDSQRKAAKARADADAYSEKTRADADKRAADTTSKAGAQAKATIEAGEKRKAELDAAGAKARAGADEYSRQTREAADRKAREIVEAAEAKARRIVAEGERRRSGIETLIRDLAARRDSALRELERLSDDVRSTAAAHSPAAAGEDPFAAPDVLDPEEREAAAAQRPSPARRESRTEGLVEETRTQMKTR